MSKIDEKAIDVGNDSSGFIVLFFIIGFVASLVFGWVIFPKLLYCEKQQPIQFDHALHAAETGGCESCHFFREDGSFSGVPKLAQCTDCHSGDPEGTEFQQHVAQQKEIPWLVYSKQPDCVFFSHAAHVKAGGMECKTCHGDIGESSHSRPYEYNIITGYSRDIWGKNIAGIKKHTWDRMKMDDCAECHAKSGKKSSSVQTDQEACFVCHK